MDRSTLRPSPWQLLQRCWQAVTGVAAYVFLLRVPLLVAALCAWASWQASRPLASAFQLVHGAFDLRFGGMVTVSALAGLLAISLSVQAGIILRYGAVRLGAPPLPPLLAKRIDLKLLAPERISLAVACILSAAVLWLLGAVHANSKGQNWWGAVAFGLALAVITFVVLVWLARDNAWLRGLVTRAFRRLAELGGEAGYLDAKRTHLPGHGLATLCLTLSAIAYAMGRYEVFKTPVLASILLLLLVLAFFLSGASFFLDGQRVPFLLFVGAVALITAQFGASDEFYRAKPTPAAYARAKPAAVLRGGGAQDPGTAIIVCASGGGSQAGAWAATVMTGLHRDTQGTFSRDLRLISSVSGGSYGTLYFTASYEHGTLQNPDSIPASALASSLDEVGRGFVFEDLPRLLLPQRNPDIGRGAALEKAWSDRKHHPAAPDPEVTIADWANDVARYWRPAHIFNSMAVETGERVVFATFDSSGGNEQTTNRDQIVGDPLDKAPSSTVAVRAKAVSVDGAIPNVAVVTAARLSSGFPFVGPAARADRNNTTDLHLVDGGYYDSDGVVSAVEFLLRATEGAQPCTTSVKRVLLVRIVGYTAPPASDASVGGASVQVKGGGERSWLYQLYAPLQGLLRVRGSAQTTRNATDIALLKEVLARRGVELEDVGFTFPVPEPLSWHLTSAEQIRLGEVWTNNADIGRGRKQVMSFLNGGATSEAACPPAPTPSRQR